MLAGGSDAPILRIGILGFYAMGALAQRNDATACRPFDATRDGTILGEGSAVLILEELSHAQKRGARSYVEVLGHATNLDTNNIVEPDMTGQSAAHTMRAAISRSSLQPDDISYIHAHARQRKRTTSQRRAGSRLCLEGKRLPLVRSNRCWGTRWAPQAQSGWR
jgi:3-oxoacyl-[acyl-carrier-protein] synthase II